MVHKKDYQLLNIYELRCLGRECGVRAPTSLNKNEIIKELIAIEKGEKKSLYQKA